MIDDGDVRILHGDALEQLATLPDESVHCIVTSPPFWALRDYGADGQIGLEATPEEWCARLVDVFRECRRVLRSDGVLWLEVGDTYNGSTSSGGPSAKQLSNAGSWHDASRPLVPGCKPKDLVGAPWMLAFALRADGWYLRSDTIWARPNPMPESVTDRPTKAHSYVFLLAKSARYVYDADAIREDATHEGRVITLGPKSMSKGQAAGIGIEPSGNGAKDAYTVPAGRNARSVWSIATEPTPFAHFATFPQALVERCIKAGTSEHGCCSECGAPWVRVTDRELVPTPKASHTHIIDARDHAADRNDQGSNRQKDGHKAGHITKVTTTGWAPSCTHDAPTTPCTVLDPFMGSGTTALVARRLGRHAVGVELNADYVVIARTRLQQLSLFAGVLA